MESIYWRRDEALKVARERAYASVVTAAKAEHYDHEDFEQLLRLAIAYVAMIYGSQPDEALSDLSHNVLNTLIKGDAVGALSEVNMLAPKQHLPNWRIPKRRVFLQEDGFHSEK